MSKSRLFYVPHYWEEELRVTEQLTAEQELAYRRLKDFIYRTEDDLLDRDEMIARLMKMGKVKWRRVKLELKGLGLIRLDDGKIRVESCTEQLAKAQENWDNKSLAGRKSSEARKRRENDSKSLKPLNVTSTDVVSVDDTSECANEHSDDPSSVPKAKSKTKTKVKCLAAESVFEISGVEEVLRVCASILDLDPSSRKHEYGLVSEWLALGVDPDKTIFPLLRSRVGKMRESGQALPNSIKYFDKAVREAFATPSQHQGSGGVKRNEFSPRVLVGSLQQIAWNDYFKDRDGGLPFSVQRACIDDDKAWIVETEWPPGHELHPGKEVMSDLEIGQLFAA